MAKIQAEVNQSDIKFWLPDADDLDRVLHLLEICGYTDKCMALDDASQSGDCNAVIEVTIRRKQISIAQPAREESIVIENLHDGTWQA